MSLKRPSLLESLVAQLPTPVSILKLSSRENKDFEYIYVNDTGVRFSGLERDFWIGKTTRKLSPSIYEGVGSLPEAMMQVIDTRNTVSLDAVGYVDDTIGPVISSFTIHYLEEDHIALVIKEVKKERELSEELSLQKQMLEMGEETTGSCSWVLDLNTEKLIYTPSFVKVFQLENEDVNSTNILSKVLERVHPEDQERVLKFLEKSHDRYPVSEDYRYGSKDGKWIWLKDTISQKREEKILLGTSQNITESRERETKLKEALHFLEKILDTTPEIVFILDIVKQETVFANKELYEELGYPQNELLDMEREAGTPLDVVLAVVHPDDKEMVLNYFTNVLPGLRMGQLAKLECRFYDRGNNAYVYFESTQAIFEQNEKGEPITIIGISRNVNAQKQAEIELLKKHKELEQFAYVASHDLQEPLRTINNFTGLLNRQNIGKFDEKTDTYLKYLSEASLRMSTLVKELLEYSRIGKQSELAGVDCNAILQEVLKDLGSSIEETRATIKIGRLPVLRGYEIELRLLFQNILTNSIKFQKQGQVPVIEISAVKMHGFWQFAFRDNGIGISDKYKEKIFIIFQRLHTNKYYKGTGIGLAHCRKIVELHGGEIWFESVLEEGTTFFVNLPSE